MDKPSRSFIGRWLGVLSHAVLEPAFTHRQYRQETMPRLPKRGAGAWRFNVGGADWTKRSRRNADRAFFAALKEERRQRAGQNAEAHAKGWSKEQHISNRTMRRKFERNNAKYFARSDLA